MDNSQVNEKIVEIEGLLAEAHKAVVSLLSRRLTGKPKALPARNFANTAQTRAAEAARDLADLLKDDGEKLAD